MSELRQWPSPSGRFGGSGGNGDWMPGTVVGVLVAFGAVALGLFALFRWVF